MNAEEAETSNYTFAAEHPSLKPQRKNGRFILLILLAQAVSHLNGDITAASNWPQFRGALGAGVAASASPPEKFGPNEGVMWKVDVPWSPSSPIVWRDLIFLTTVRDGLLETRCHDRKDGRLRWTRAVTPSQIEEFHRLDGSPAASTPTTDGHHVVSYFGSFGLICHNTEGAELWRHPLPVAKTVGQYGSGTSPIIVGKVVVINRDQYRYSSLLAVDLKTGSKLWETHRPESAGSFGTPAYWRNRDADKVVLAASGRLKGYALQTGAERWVVEGVTGTVCTTPVVAQGRLYFAAWSNHVADTSLLPWEEFMKQYDHNSDGAVAFEEIEPERRDYMRGVDANRDGKLTKADWDLRKAASVRYENVIIAVNSGGTGDITQTHVAWKSRRGVPYVPSPLFYDGRIYLVKDGGLLTSVDADTGEALYTQERMGADGNYYASPVAAEGRIYLASLAGKVTVVKAGGARPDVLHQVDFGTRIVATPAASGGNLFVRTESHLWAFTR